MFFLAPFSTSKFDLRKKIHENQNLSNLDEIDLEDDETYFTADFKTNAKFNYLSPNCGKKVSFIYNKSSNSIEFSSIKIAYKTQEVGICIKQFEEMTQRFTKISHKNENNIITTISSDEKIGDGVTFYSSSAFFDSKKPYLNVYYHYSETDKEYILSILFFKLNL